MAAMMGPATSNSTAEHTDGDPPKDSESELYQDVVSQFPVLNGYSHLAFGFQPDDANSRETIVGTLRAAVDQLVSQIPLLASQILYTPGHADTSGIYTPAPWPSEAPKNEIMRVKYCDDVMPPMAQLLRANVPVSMLDGKTLTPWPSLPVPHGLEPPWPTAALQLNFIRGGIIFNVSIHHMVFDGTGLMQLMRHLATILQGHKIPAVDIEQANRDRRYVVPLIPRGEPVKDHSYLRAPPGYRPTLPSSPPKWCYFKLPVSALPTLRKLASSTLAVSDNDMLCAFCWQRITAARLARGFSPETQTKVTRAIDARGAVGIPPTYMGHLVYFCGTQLSLPMSRVASTSLSTIAQTLRRELNGANTAWAVRSFATFIAREQDRSRLVYTGLRNFDTDLGATSFIASQGDGRDGEAAMLDSFGPVLGRLLFTRRPDVSPMPGSITLQPAENGAIPIALCLPEADLEELKKDGEWRRYTRYVG